MVADIYHGMGDMLRGRSCIPVLLRRQATESVGFAGQGDGTGGIREPA